MKNKLKELLEFHNVEKEYIKTLLPIADKITAVLTEKDIPQYKNKVFIHIPSLTKEQKYEIIDALHEGYFNTNIDKEDFSNEFVTVIGGFFQITFH